MEIIKLSELIYQLGSYSLSFFWMPMVLWTSLTAGYLLFQRYNLKFPPQANYQILTALILALPLGVLLAFAAPFSVSAPEALKTIFSPVPQVLNAQPALPAEAQAPQVAWHLFHFLGALTLVLLLASLYNVLQLLRETMQLNRMASSIRGVLPSDISETLDRVRQSWSIKEEVYIVFSDEEHVPMTFGWRKAFIIVPEGLRDQQEALHMTLIHELAHIKNADFVRQWIERAISSFFFFHPTVQSLTDKIDHIREMNCDWEVLSQKDISPKQYASLLLKFASPRTSAPLLSISMSAEKHNLKRRILAMKDYPLFSKSALHSRKLTLTLAAILLAASTLIVACEVKFEKDNSITIIETSPASGVMPEITVTPGAPAGNTDEEVFMIVENMPELIGGIESIQKNIKYPIIAKKAGIEGRVFIQFVVDTNGRVKDPVVVRGIGAGCDEEALRAVSLAQFNPGRQGGKVVPVKMSLPITFRLTEKTSEETGSVSPSVQGEHLIQIVRDASELNQDFVLVFAVHNSNFESEEKRLKFIKSRSEVEGVDALIIGTINRAPDMGDCIFDGKERIQPGTFFGVKYVAESDREAYRRQKRSCVVATS